MTLAPPRLWLDGGRVRHAIGADTISNDLADWIAEDLVAPGLIGPSEFEAVFVEAVLAVDADPAVAWTAFYRNTLAALGRGEGAGTNAGMAPVHARAVELAVGPHVVELGCCFGFLSLRLARAGFRVTAVDLVPGTARLLGSVAPRLLAEAATRPDEMRNSRRWDAELAATRCGTRGGTGRGTGGGTGGGTDGGTGRRTGVQRAGTPGTVTALAGDACAVPLADGAADTVFAVHLLEHLPPALAPVVLAEMLRVARRRAVVAVPFEDEPNPTWGHVRTFDLAALDALGAATGCPYAVAEFHGGWLVVDA